MDFKFLQSSFYFFLQHHAKKPPLYLFIYKWCNILCISFEFQKTTADVSICLQLAENKLLVPR